VPVKYVENQLSLGHERAVYPVGDSLVKSRKASFFKSASSSCSAETAPAENARAGLRPPSYLEAPLERLAKGTADQN